MSLSSRAPSTPIDAGTLRLLDASLNRVAEGFRTLEEISRFILDDRQATAAMKSLRHDLATLEKTLPRDSRLAARDTAGDVGTTIQTPSEIQRSSHGDIAAAAASRVQQSLRVIEENWKTIDPAQASQVEGIRYRFYDASASLELQLNRLDRRARLERSSIYALVTAMESAAVFEGHLERLFDAGVDIVQLRDRSVTDRQLLERCRIAQAVARRKNGLFIVNDRADIAAACDADGVHVGQDELPTPDVRSIVGSDRLVGLSTHDIDQVDSANDQPIDYIGCGPVFPSRTKSFDQYTGTQWLVDVASRSRLPAFAIGGINVENAAQIAAAGIHRIAVSGVLNPTDQGNDGLPEVVVSLRRSIRGES